MAHMRITNQHSAVVFCFALPRVTRRRLCLFPLGEEGVGGGEGGFAVNLEINSSSPAPHLHARIKHNCFYISCTFFFLLLCDARHAAAHVIPPKCSVLVRLCYPYSVNTT